MMKQMIIKEREETSESDRQDQDERKEQYERDH